MLTAFYTAIRRRGLEVIPVIRQGITVNAIDVSKHRNLVNFGAFQAERAAAGHISRKSAAFLIGDYIAQHGMAKLTRVAKALIVSDGLPAGFEHEDDHPFPDCLTVHHQLFPISNFRDRIAIAYRELPQNKVILCEEAHRVRHDTDDAVQPDRPPFRTMAREVVESYRTMSPDLVTHVRGMLHGETL